MIVSLAITFNNFFISIAGTLLKKIVANFIQRKIKKYQLSTYQLEKQEYIPKNVTKKAMPEQVLKVLKAFNLNKANGPNSINT